MTHFEQSVIGSILLTNGKALDTINLTPDDFVDPSHVIIYRTMLDMKHNRSPIDVITVAGKLPRLAAYLHETMTVTPTPASVGFYASKVAEEATKKKLALTATLISDKAKTADVEEAIDLAKREIDSLLERNSAVRPSYVDDELIPYLDQLDKPRDYPKTPWQQLNAIIGGLRPGALYIIGARPGIGKTIVGLQLAWELSKTGPVSFHSLEMGKTELYNRIIAMEASVYIGNIEKGTISDYEWDKIAKTVKTGHHQLAIHDK